MKDTKLIRDIKEITDNPDIHFWIKCKRLTKVATYGRPGSYEGESLIRQFFKTCAGRFKDRFDTAYVRPYLDRWEGRQTYDYVNKKQLNDDLSCKIGKSPRGIKLTDKIDNLDRFENYLKHKYPEAFEEFEEIKKVRFHSGTAMGKTNDYAWQHIFGNTIWQLTSIYGQGSKLSWGNISQGIQDERRKLDFAMEKAQADYSQLKKLSKLPPRYLYNEVSLAELQQNRQNHTYAKFKDHYITTETVLHYDNAEVHHGLGKLTHTDRQVRIHDKTGFILSTVLESYSGHFVLNALEEYLGKVKKIKVPAELKPVQLNSKMAVLEMTKLGSFRTFERLFNNGHYDYCVLREGITYHSKTIEGCLAGWKKKKAIMNQAEKADSKIINMKFCRSLHFCKEGIEGFCIDNGIDPGSDYTVGEIKSVINKRLVHNQHHYGVELPRIGVL